jgi:hypothetical protein
MWHTLCLETIFARIRHTGMTWHTLCDTSFGIRFAGFTYPRAGRPAPANSMPFYNVNPALHRQIFLTPNKFGTFSGRISWKIFELSALAGAGDDDDFCYIVFEKSKIEKISLGRFIK